jgi:hypothetical protein
VAKWGRGWWVVWRKVDHTHHHKWPLWQPGTSAAEFGGRMNIGRRKRMNGIEMPQKQIMRGTRKVANKQRWIMARRNGPNMEDELMFGRRNQMFGMRN